MASHWHSPDMSRSSRFIRGAAKRGGERWARRWLRAVAGLFRRNQRRYGGYVVHLGVTVIGIGVIASSAFQTETQHTLARGESDKRGRIMRCATTILPAGASG